MLNPPAELTASMEQIRTITQRHKHLVDALLHERELTLLRDQFAASFASAQASFDKITVIYLPETPSIALSSPNIHFVQDLAKEQYNAFNEAINTHSATKKPMFSGRAEWSEQLDGYKQTLSLHSNNIHALDALNRTLLPIDAKDKERAIEICKKRVSSFHNVMLASSVQIVIDQIKSSLTQDGLSKVDRAVLDGELNFMSNTWLNIIKTNVSLAEREEPEPFEPAIILAFNKLQIPFEALSLQYAPDGALLFANGENIDAVTLLAQKELAVAHAAVDAHAASSKPVIFDKEWHSALEQLTFTRNLHHQNVKQLSDVKSGYSAFSHKELMMLDGLIATASAQRDLANNVAVTAVARTAIPVMTLKDIGNALVEEEAFFDRANAVVALQSDESSDDKLKEVLAQGGSAVAMTGLREVAAKAADELGSEKMQGDIVALAKALEEIKARVHAQAKLERERAQEFD
jgi:hypothetical protein